jgi:hypothetical protein
VNHRLARHDDVRRFLRTTSCDFSTRISREGCFGIGRAG